MPGAAGIKGWECYYNGMKFWKPSILKDYRHLGLETSSDEMKLENMGTKFRNGSGECPLIVMGQVESIVIKTLYSVAFTVKQEQV